MRDRLNDRRLEELSERRRGKERRREDAPDHRPHAFNREPAAVIQGDVGRVDPRRTLVSSSQSYRSRYYTRNTYPYQAKVNRDVGSVAKHDVPLYCAGIALLAAVSIKNVDEIAASSLRVQA